MKLSRFVLLPILTGAVIAAIMYLFDRGTSATEILCVNLVAGAAIGLTWTKPKC
jgi:hypothetical protein